VTSNRVRPLLGRRALGIAAAAALAMAGTLAVGPTAQATGVRSPAVGLAPTIGHAATRETFTIPAGTDTFSASAGSTHVTVTRSATVSPDATITCNLVVNPPFYYQGSPNGEEGIASITCNLSAAEIYIEVGLYENGSLVSYHSNEVYSTNFATVDTTASASPGDYKTGGVATVYAPAGDTPATSNYGEKYSSIVYLQ
jgi:hypothetical protein